MRKLSLFAAVAVILLATLMSGGRAIAQATITPLDYLPALKGGYFPLQSRAVGHLYHIYVRLPEGYETDPQRRYPVVYVLDGDSLFPIIAPTHLFLTIDDKVPEVIVVGISYGSFSIPTNQRHIDFMPSGEDMPPGAKSGTFHFQRFLETELIPAVEQRYRADPARRILFGQSRAGGMVLYSAFTKPDLFWAHIAHNPSWVPGHELFFGTAPRTSRNDLKLVVVLGTNEKPDRRELAFKWFKQWGQRVDAPWLLKRIDIPGGTHSAFSPDAYRASIRWLFGDQIARP